MYFSKTIVALALAAVPISALPTEETNNNLVTRAGSYTCHPKDNKSTAKFVVSAARAEAQAKVALYTAGKSGDPHKYGNGDNIRWGVNGCNTKGNQLYEYPIYWDDLKKEWQKDEVSKNQDKTPLRVVYIEDNGTHDKRPKVCGVMTHSKVDKDNQGKDFFQKCDST